MSDITAREMSEQKAQQPTEVAYGNWSIGYCPPPIPARNCDWWFSHKDFDGAEDACDNRYGYAGSLVEAMDEIDLIEDEAFECGECRMACPAWCMKAAPCKHRDDFRARQAAANAAIARAEPQP